MAKCNRRAGAVTAARLTRIQWSRSLAVDACFQLLKSRAASCELFMENGEEKRDKKRAERVKKSSSLEFKSHGASCLLAAFSATFCSM